MIHRFTIKTRDFTTSTSMYFVFSAADEEAFEDNSEEYIRRDLEGSGNPQIYTKNTWSLNIALKS